MKSIYKICGAVFVLLCISIGLYPLTYFIVDREFGLLAFKSQKLLSNVLWNIGFYFHIIFGGISLLIGWLQFNKKLRIWRIQFHRTIGKIYVFAVILSGFGGIGIAFSATGGLASTIGFMSLGIIWIVTTMLGFTSIKKNQIELHKKYMIYSYALCFSAVTLRLWLPILIPLNNGEFVPAYQIVAWLCWVPNIVVAYLLIDRKSQLSNNV